MREGVLKARLRLLWDWLHSSYWFLPGLLLLVAAGAAFALTAVDRGLDQDAVAKLSGVFGGGPEGARSVLLAIASSVLGVAGTTFAVTIAVLTLTSSQFGPRLLRNFLKDTGSQLVLGTFIGTFLYALLVLRTVRSLDDSAFVPHVAVTFALVLAVLSIAMLVYFIQHTVASIQATEIIDTAAAELVDAVERLYPSHIGAPAAPESSFPAAAGCADVRATSSGYLQAVDGDRLLECASERGAMVQLLRMPGEFVSAGTVAARVAPAPARDEALEARINSALSLGAHPTQVQDLLFSVNQLSEIATRALSPGTNDPNTAIMCIDRLNEGLCRLAARPFPSACRADAEGKIRLWVKTPTFAQVLHAAFAQVRRYGRSDAQVLTRLLETFAEIGSCAAGERRLEELRRQADLVLEESREGLSAREAREQVAQQHRHTLAQLKVGREVGVEALA